MMSKKKITIIGVAALVISLFMSIVGLLVYYNKSIKHLLNFSEDL